MTDAAGFSIRGRSISGCVFFICTADFTGGSGKTVIRAVSFFGAGEDIGAGIAAALAPRSDCSIDGDGGLAGGRVGR